MGRSTIVLTTLAMIAFAANSLFARLALAEPAIDAFSYTAVRLVAGAIVLAVLWRLSRRQGGPTALPGSWTSALALFAYALTFSLAYLRLGAAVGALVLFASVQMTMVSFGVLRGHRPSPAEWAGLAIAFAAFVYLVLPGLDRPDPLGCLLMVASGAAWGAYSLRGRGATDPVGETTGNFVRSVAFCVPLAVLAIADHRVTVAGLGWAVASGGLASGIGYVIWYRALPGLAPVQAAIVQLSVPVIAAFGAVLLVGEPLTTRLVVAAVFVLGGIALAIRARVAPAS